MEVATAYILENSPKIISIDSSSDSNFSSKLNLRGSYIFGENVPDFIHHQYSEYWDRGIPIIHIASEIVQLENGDISSLKKVLYIFTKLTKTGKILRPVPPSELECGKCK